MSLSLAAPAVLALAGLLVLPIVAHMARQVPRDRTPFGSMLLLQRVVKRLKRRRRIKDLLLLVLRILVVLLVLLAVAGLRLTVEGVVPEYGGSGRVVVVLDRSMSMAMHSGGSTVLERARARAIEVVRGLGDGALVGAVLFDSQAERITPSLGLDRDRIIARFEAVQPTYGRSNLRQALIEARKLLGGEPGEVVLLSDEAGPQMVPEAMVELTRLVEAGSAVIPIDLGIEARRNVAVTGAKYGSGIEGGQVTVSLTNFGPDAVEVACEVSLPDGQVMPAFVELPHEASGTERFTVPPEALGGVGRVHCDDPDLPLDDTLFFHLPRVGASRVLVVDGSPGDTPTDSEVYFLERALAPWGGTQSGVTPDVVSAKGLLDLDPERHQVVFLANMSDPRAAGPRLTEFVRRGGSLIIGLGDNVAPDRYNASLGSVLPSRIRRVLPLAAAEEPGLALLPPVVGLDLFEPFERRGRPAFARVRSRRIFTLDPYQDSDEVTTLLRYEGGQPALVERRVGLGRVVLWTSSLDSAWTSLPMQSVFMPLMQRLVAHLGGEAGGGAGRIDGEVGVPIRLELPDLTMEPEVLTAAGQPVRSSIEGHHLVFTPEQPGAFQIVVPSAPPLAWVAVNVPDESDVRLYETVAAAESQLDPDLFRQHRPLAPWLFALALLLALVQAALALQRRT